MAEDRRIPMDLLEAGDPAFIDAVRRVQDAEALGALAADWYDDRRPTSRRLLFAYLDRPLNAFRHEVLVKRLFKRAEADGDDALMARFLVAFDRSIRRIQKPDGAIVVPRGTTMPRGRVVEFRLWWEQRTIAIHDWAVRWYRLVAGSEPMETDLDRLPAVIERMQSQRLFRVETRNHLRRRVWRYFRRLGRSDPARYIAAVAEALALYDDDDTTGDLAMLDNAGLVQILYPQSPALERRAAGWRFRPGRSSADLAPAPICESAWADAPGVVVGLLTSARSAVVRRWAAQRVAAEPDRHRPALEIDGWLDLLGHDDPGVVVVAADVLDQSEGLAAIPPGRWPGLIEAADPSTLGALSDLIASSVDPKRVSVADAAGLARLGPLPVARLGFSWLEARGETFGPEDLPELLVLLDAESGPLRPTIAAWLRRVLAGSPGFEPGMILAFLESRHVEVRREGWAWFQADPRGRNDIETWRKLLESPHTEIRRALVVELEARMGSVDDPSRIGRGLDPEALRGLWAAVLLDVRGSSRVRPMVVRQIARRLEGSPGEAPELLPLLGVALRSVRGVERRAALAAVVGLVDRLEAELGTLVRSSFPELQIA